MNKPTPEEIIASTKTRSFKLLETNISDIIEYVTLVYHHKKDAFAVCKSINEKYGQWVFAMVHDEWTHPHLSVSYRSKELSKCERCGWLDGMHSPHCHYPG